VSVQESLFFNLNLTKLKTKTMAKYRILQEGESSFYPQEKLSIFHHWRYLDNRFSKYIWERISSAQSRCETLTQAQERVAARKQFLKERIKYPIIHKID
jgi:predicted transcriptional regulator